MFLLMNDSTDCQRNRNPDLYVSQLEWQMSRVWSQLKKYATRCCSRRGDPGGELTRSVVNANLENTEAGYMETGGETLVPSSASHSSVFTEINDRRWYATGPLFYPIAGGGARWARASLQHPRRRCILFRCRFSTALERLLCHETHKHALYRTVHKRTSSFSLTHIDIILYDRQDDIFGRGKKIKFL